MEPTAIENNGTIAPSGTSGSPWYSSLPPELASQDTIKQIPDVPTLAKSYLDAQKEIGGRVRFPGKDAKPEERSAFTSKLREGGYLPVVPEKPDAYQINRPQEGPWNDNWEKAAREVFHKMGYTQEQAAAAVSLHEQMVAETIKAGKELEAANLEALKKQWGADYDTNAEFASRAGALIFGSAEEAARHSGNSDPKWLNALVEVGKRLEGANGFAPAGSQGAGNGDAAKEMTDIIRNPQNPKYKLYWAGDQETVKYVNGLRDQAWPGETQIS